MSDTKHPATIHELLIRQAYTRGRAPALLTHGRQPLTYDGLRSEVERTLSALAAAGVGRGSRVAFALPNGPEATVLMLSVLAGATCVPLNPTLGPANYDTVLRELGVDALIAAEGADTPAAAIARSLGLQVLRFAPRIDDVAGAFDLHVQTGRPAVPRTAPRPDDLAAIYQTSGTTSKPKSVPLTQAQVMARTRQQPIDSADRGLFVAPMFTGGALGHTLLAPIAAGASIGFARNAGEDALLDALEDLGVTCFSANPTVLSSLLERVAQRGPVRPTALRFVRSAAIALTAELQLRLEDALGVPVIQGYGMTETGTIAQNPLPPGRRKHGSVGVSVGPEIAIIDADGERVGPNVTGEIVVRGPGVMAGYENDPEASRKALRGGWFHTGDLGHLDDDGYLFIVGRMSEIVNRGGMKVSPAEVDEALLRHADVLEAATFGVPHPSLGEDVGAAVVIRGQSKVTAQRLREFLFDQLPAYKVPSTVVFVDALPRTATKKVNRAALAKALQHSLRPEFVAPRNAHEALVMGIFAEVLRVDRVGVHDNFFQLGGDSLRGMQLIAWANSTFGTNLQADSLFVAPTVAAFAAAVAAAGRGEGSPPPATPKPNSGRRVARSRQRAD